MPVDRLTDERHSNRQAKADCEAQDELAGQIEGDCADDGAHVPAGLQEGSGQAVEDGIHFKILDRNLENVNPQHYGVFAPFLSGC